MVFPPKILNHSLKTFNVTVSWFLVRVEAGVHQVLVWQYSFALNAVLCFFRHVIEEKKTDVPCRLLWSTEQSLIG